MLLRPEVKILCIELGVAHGSSPISGHRPSRFWDIQAEGIYTLADLRDTLLPKLISGELRVKDVERFIGRAV